MYFGRLFSLLACMRCEMQSDMWQEALWSLKSPDNTCATLISVIFGTYDLGWGYPKVVLVFMKDFY